MSGRASRQKGMRGEYAVRDMFRLLGADAHRVPLSGAAQGFKGDVMVTFPDRQPFYIEVKKRRNEFDRIYKLLAEIEPTLTCVGLASQGGLCVAIGTDFTKVDALDHFLYASTPEHTKLVDRLLQMRTKWQKDCDYLAIQGDRKPILVVRFL